MSKTSKARKEKLNKGFANVPVAQREAYAKNYYSPKMRYIREVESMVDFIKNAIRLSFGRLTSLPMKEILFNRYIKDLKQQPDGSFTYTLLLPYEMKQYVGEYSIGTEPTKEEKLAANEKVYQAAKDAISEWPQWKKDYAGIE